MPSEKDDIENRDWSHSFKVTNLFQIWRSKLLNRWILKVNNIPASYHCSVFPYVNKMWRHIKKFKSSPSDVRRQPDQRHIIQTKWRKILELCKAIWESTQTIDDIEKSFHQPPSLCLLKTWPINHNFQEGVRFKIGEFSPV